jgi:hypothetical protein
MGMESLRNEWLSPILLGLSSVDNPFPGGGGMNRIQVALSIGSGWRTAPEYAVHFSVSVYTSWLFYTIPGARRKNGVRSLLLAILPDPETYLCFEKSIPFNPELLYGSFEGPNLEITISPIGQYCGTPSPRVIPLPVRTTTPSREFFAVEDH